MNFKSFSTLQYLQLLIIYLRLPGAGLESTTYIDPQLTFDRHVLLTLIGKFDIPLDGNFHLSN